MPDPKVKVVIGSQAELGGFKQAIGAFDQLAGRVLGLNGFLQGVRAQVAGLLGAGAFASLVRTGIQFQASLEQSQIAFTTLLGSAGAAATRIAELNRFAAQTPFELPQVVAASRLLQSLAGDALASGEGLRLVGDAASASGRSFEDTAMWIGRLYAGLKSGTPVGEATMRLLEMGLVSGETKRRLDALAQSGAQGGRAFDVLRREFGRFTGSMEAQSRTLTGLFSTLADAWRNMLADQTSGIFERLKTVVAGLISLLQSSAFREGLHALKNLLLSAALVAGGLALAAAIHKIGAELAALVWIIRSSNLATGLSMIFTNAQVAVMGLTARISALVAVMYTLIAAYELFEAEQALTEARSGEEFARDRARLSVDAALRRVESEGGPDAPVAGALRRQIGRAYTPVARMENVTRQEPREPGAWGPGREVTTQEMVSRRDPQAEREAVRAAGEFLRARVGRRRFNQQAQAGMNNLMEGIGRAFAEMMSNVSQPMAGLLGRTTFQTFGELRAVNQSQQVGRQMLEELRIIRETLTRGGLRVDMENSAI